MPVRLKRYQDQERRPWRNGGGSTTELANFPPGGDAASDFDWRVSIADVTESGAFSKFPGVDRIITLIEGAAMTLRDGGHGATLELFAPYAFDGDADIRCEVIGACRALNVMARRGRASVTVDVAHIASRVHVEPSPRGHLLVVGLEGSLRVLGAGGALRLDGGDSVTSDEPLEIDGVGRVALVRMG